jgi:hypothetical protein
LQQELARHQAMLKQQPVNNSSSSSLQQAQMRQQLPTDLQLVACQEGRQGHS